MSTGSVHPVLERTPGSAPCILGNVAIVRGGLEAGVQYFSCYPGTPSSEIGDTFSRIAGDAGVIFEYSVNEKIAVETAFAASLAGARSMCAMKHLGLNYAGDPISTMPYVGVEGGMVIVSAGDPSAFTSPNEQDQRHVSRFLFYPVFDPATPADALAMTRFAFELSEETRLPVIIRPTTRVCHTSGIVEFGALPEEKNEIEFKKDPARYSPIPVNARRMRTELIERFALAEKLLAESPFFPRTGEGKRGIVASGVAYAYVSQAVRDLGIEDRVSLLKTGAYPIPRKILADFIGSVESILVVEELTPFVEEETIIAAHRSGKGVPVYGKLSGHFPQAFEYDPDLVEDAVRGYLDMEPRPAAASVSVDLPPRPPVLCPGCPHRASFYAVKKVFGKKTVYINDIGCYTLGYGPPLESCDLLLCMGSSISKAAGIARTTGERTVAFIGDSTFFHSGLAPLADAVEGGDDITVVVLNNYVTAMTGFQPSFATRNPIESTGHSRGLSIEDAARGLGLGAGEVYSADPFDEEAAICALTNAKEGKGTNVVVMNAPCVVNDKRLGTRSKRPVYEIDPELCNRCSLCIRTLGCPAICVEVNEVNEVN